MDHDAEERKRHAGDPRETPAQSGRGPRRALLRSHRRAASGSPLDVIAQGCRMVGSDENLPHLVLEAGSTRLLVRSVSVAVAGAHALPPDRGPARTPPATRQPGAGREPGSAWYSRVEGGCHGNQ